MTSFTQNANTRHFYLLVKRLGLKLTLPSDTYNSSQVTTQKIWKQSKNSEIGDWCKATAPKNIDVHQNKPKHPKERLVSKTVNKILDGMKTLKVCKRRFLQLTNNTNLFRWKNVSNKQT